MLLAPVLEADETASETEQAENKIHGIVIRPEIEKIHFRPPTNHPRKKPLFSFFNKSKMPLELFLPSREDIQFLRLLDPDHQSNQQVFFNASQPRAVPINRNRLRYLSDVKGEGMYSLRSYPGDELLRQPEEGERFVEFSNDGKSLFAQKRVADQLTQLIRVYDSTSGDRIHEITVPCFDRIYFSPDGFRFAARDAQTESYDYKIWETRTGKPVCTLEGTDSLSPYTDPVQFESKNSWSPDGQYFLNVESNNKFDVGVWDTTTGKCTRTLDFPWNISTARYSPDGSQILVVGGMEKKFSKEVRINGVLYDARTGDTIRSFVTTDDYVPDAAFSHDGKFIFATGQNLKGLYVWRVSEDSEENGDVSKSRKAR
ncbi:WD40 repeat domain-containing protein [Polystyrenella longa]|nr:hypothetical protein [Polystyrenella longa]